MNPCALRHLVRRVALLTVIGSAFPLAAAAAQDSTTATHPRMCFRGRAKPACDRFFLTEIGVYHPIVSSRVTYNGFVGGTPYRLPVVDRQLTFQVGAMANRGSRSAVGGTVIYGFGMGAADFGVLARYRRWLTPDGFSLDLSAGVIQGKIDGALFTTGDARGATAEIALNAADYGAVVLRTDFLRGGGQTNSALLAGVRAGSRPAVAATAGLAIVWTAIIAAFASSDW
ncbi:MAG: hypothetical protein IT353_12940 [Gemmatimonadaceae bacterium]|nr:hypothetical protein [Gemmatimonadaceae bacterium]